jgi:hypothetical protein
MNAEESRENQSLRILAYTSITKHLKTAGLITDKEEQLAMDYISGLRANLDKPKRTTLHCREKTISK